MKINYLPKFQLLSVAALLIVLSVSPISAAAQSLTAGFQISTDLGQAVTPVVAGIELKIYSISGRFILQSDIAITDQHEEPLEGALVNLEITQSPAYIDPYKDYQGRVRYISGKTNAEGITTIFTKYQRPGKWMVCVDSIEYENKEVIPGVNSQRCSVITN